MKYNSKEALLSDISREFNALVRTLDEIPPHRQLDPGVWGEDWNVRDLIAHLYAWHQLFLTWWHAGQRGETPELPAPGFKWNETPSLNREIQQRYHSISPGDVRLLLETSHFDVLQIAEGTAAPVLLNTGQFAWTGRNAMITYLAANTASHYRFANKVLARWQRNTGRTSSPPGMTTDEGSAETTRGR